MSAWLIALACSTDRGLALVRAPLDEMRQRRILAPAPVVLDRPASVVRHRARREADRALTVVVGSPGLYPPAFGVRSYSSSHARACPPVVVTYPDSRARIRVAQHQGFRQGGASPPSEVRWAGCANLSREAVLDVGAGLETGQ